MSRIRSSSPLVRSLPLAAVLGAMGLAAGLLLPRLGERAFWDDEANTAINARNLLRFGRITAWDGTNLCGYGLGSGLGEDLGQELRVPPLPTYAAALSMGFFKQTTWAMRLPFVMAGVASVGILAVWMRRHFGHRFPWWLPSVFLALNTAFLLYSRNCRYYSLGVLFTLILLACWAPGRSGTRRERSAWFLPSDVVRWSASAVSLLLVIGTHYLNAAAALVVLPLLFFDRRYRTRRQFVLAAVLGVTAAAAGGWILATANPWKTQYTVGQTWLFAPPQIPDWSERFQLNLFWFFRDLGTHEFIPWLLLPLLLLPLAPWRRARGQAGLARHGSMFAVMVLAYVLTAAAAIPPDMGKGPAAEMRYVVPLTALGAAISGLTVVMAWRICRPVALAVVALLLGTNWLFLGGLLERSDRLNPWWPPTLYCYVQELFAPVHVGDEELLELLAELPAGATVRVWPSFMAYPPMFYVPQLHYCDQLTERKPIRADLRAELPDYLFVEKAQPDVVVVPADFLGLAADYLRQTTPSRKYRVAKALRKYFYYVGKPEIPGHWFRLPDAPWHRLPGAIVLVAEGSAADGSPALASDAFDRKHGAYALWTAAGKAAAAGALDAAAGYCRESLQLDPGLSGAHVTWGTVCELRKQRAEAMTHYRAAIDADPDNAVAHYNLANLLMGLDEVDEAEKHYVKALAARPDYAQAHYNLGCLLLRQGRTTEAKQHLSAAIASAPAGAQLVQEAQRLLRQIK